MEFRDQVAIVTGASRGIGRAVAEGLAARGASVVVGYLARADQAAETVAACEHAGGQALALAADVRSADGAEALVAAALDRWGRLDVLVTCAGIARFAAIAGLAPAQWREVLAVNLTGVYHCCRAVLRPMMRRRYGRIVNVAALHGRAGGPFQADYSAAAGGVLGLTRALAREAAPWQITVNAVAPGLVETEQLGAIPAEMRAWGERVIALRRAGTPAEVAAAALFLASPAASYITAQTLYVDGGWSTT